MQKFIQLIIGDENQQCSKQRLYPEKETCDQAQKACLVYGKNMGRESNHNLNNRNKEILAYGNMFLDC